MNSLSSLPESTDSVSAQLQRARSRLYAVSGGSARSGDVTAARLTTAQRTEYFRSPEFCEWVAFENANGRQVFWLKDVDKTQAAGDIFTFFFQWRAENDKFSPRQLASIRRYLRRCRGPVRATGIVATRLAMALPTRLLGARMPQFADLTPQAALRLWQSKEAGDEDGIGLLDFWSNVYWPSQAGMTRAEKIQQVTDFAPTYTSRIYPGVRQENEALTAAGVEVVIVTNGDQELAIAAAPYLGIKPENVVGSHLIYDGEHSTGENHAYEIMAEEWAGRPQPGKPLSFHYWIYMNRKRWCWDHLDEHQIIIAGRDGDSASSDGGMMIFLPTPAIGNFMIDTPGEPGRLKKFQSVTSKYGWTRGQFFTLVQVPSRQGWKP
jgi:hypothetical protein